MNLAQLESTAPVVVPRTIVYRTRGTTQGPITRLVSPGDVGEIIKPFVFLDSFAAEPRGFGGMGWHPHSGIATVSVLLSGSVGYEETTGQKGVLGAGSVEWMRAGKGVWHTGSLVGTERIEGFQLWVALPPELEGAPAQSHYLAADDVATVGPARVILGKHGDAKSAIPTPSGLTYLVVSLAAGERWRYQPARGHTVGFMAVQSGRVRTPERVAAGELAVFDSADSAIDFVSDEASVFVLGSAVPHPHELVLGSYSVHTTRQALVEGEAEIRRIHSTTPMLRGGR